MDIEVTESALTDLERVSGDVEETFWSKIRDVERNLDLGASPGQAFDKYLSGPMHPLLQMNLGRDYRAWFLEGTYVKYLGDDTVYCLKILSKPEAVKLSRSMRDAILFFRDVLEQYQDP